MSLSQIFHNPVSLTDEQIKALPTTPVELIPAPGANKILVPLMAIVRNNTSAGAYTNVNSQCQIEFRWSIGSTSPLNAFLNLPGVVTETDLLLGATNYVWQIGLRQFPAIEEGSETGYNTLNFAESAQVINRALQLHALNDANGDFTGGHANNAIHITIFYAIIDV